MLLVRYSRTAISLLTICSTLSMAQSTIKGHFGKTSWVGNGANKVPFVLEFQENGRLLYLDINGTVSRGKWKRHGDAVEIDVHRGTLKLTGVVQDEGINGVALGANGLQWEWFATKQPVVTQRSSPKYPPLEVAARIAGSVMTDIEIGPGGNVTNAHAINGHPSLRKLSEEAARGWRFQPVERASLRIARLVFIFRLLDKERDEKVSGPVFLSPYRIEIRRGIPSVQYKID